MNAARLLRHARRAAGLTQRDLAARAGVPQSTVGRIERGRLMPRVDTFDRLLRAAGLRIGTERAAGDGEDRTLIRDRLAMSPAQRARLAVSEARAMSALDRRSRR